MAGLIGQIKMGRSAVMARLFFFTLAGLSRFLPMKTSFLPEKLTRQPYEPTQEMFLRMTCLLKRVIQLVK